MKPIYTVNSFFLQQELGHHVRSRWDRPSVTSMIQLRVENLSAVIAVPDYAPIDHPMLTNLYHVVSQAIRTELEADLPDGTAISSNQKGK